ncbi:MAG: hypothetical protein H6698_08815 [Myxococcales bacterium]|nr:hypothetical protein [Myxococcales bacterium]MCB9534386.1 hypothetical protein [Myxococcales bacterium]
MFRALEIGSVIDLDPGQLIAIERSTNTQSLALGGGARKPTRAFILSFFEAHGAYRVAVFLGRIERDREGRPHGLLFRCDPPQVPLTGYEALLREATAMVQSQGFVMERVDFATARAEERARMISELPFHPDRLVPPPPAGIPTTVELQPTHAAQPLPDVSREIRLPEAESIARLGKLLSLF